jgi:WD40 repeat protein
VAVRVSIFTPGLFGLLILSMLGIGLLLGPSSDKRDGEFRSREEPRRISEERGLGETGDVGGGLFLRRLSRLTPLGGPITALAYAPDGTQLATSDSDGRVTIWDVRLGVERQTFEAPRGLARSLSFSPDGRLLALGQFGGSVTLWNLVENREWLSLKTDGDCIRAIAFSADGGMLAAGSLSGSLTVWERHAGASGQHGESASAEPGQAWILRDRVPGHQEGVTSLAIANDGKTIASGGKDGRLTLWDVTRLGENQETRDRTEKPPIRERVRSEETRGWLIAVAFSPDGLEVATASLFDPTVRFWDGRTGQAKRAVFGGCESILGVAYSPDGRKLAAGGTDGSIRIWQREEDALYPISTVSTRDHTRNDWMWFVAFSPDSERVATAGTDAFPRILDLGQARPQFARGELTPPKRTRSTTPPSLAPTSRQGGDGSVS